jgi:uncharacterized membrane protein YeaQ/YmgE (transglycosylase-associated protein family)
MDMHVIYFLLIGAVAGWLAGILTKGRGFGIVGDIVVGVIGAVVGGYLFRKLNISLASFSPTTGEIITATAGAIVLLIVIRVLVGKK